MAEVLPKRQDVPRERMWAIESVFETVAEWEAAFARVEAMIPSVAPFRGRLGESGTVLWEAMEAVSALFAAFGPVGLYARMLAAGDAGDQTAAGMTGRVSGLAARCSAAVAYVDPEILSIPEDQLEAFFSEEPRLATYRHSIEQVTRLRPHVRSEEVEEVLAQAREIGAGPHTLFRTFVNGELAFRDAEGPDGARHKVAQGTVGDLVQNADRNVRQAAWESYADGYLAYKNTLAANLAQSMKTAWFHARARRHESVLQARLAADAVPRTVVDNLLAVVRAHQPLWHRYWAVLRKGLGVDSLHGYDIPLYDQPSSLVRGPRAISFDDAVAMISDGMAPLGEEYVGAMRQGLTADRWVDAWPNQGKGSGAFSSGCYGTRPFIMMNFSEDIFSLSTLAHELGHSMHSHLTWRTQPYVSSHYSLFAAETASNFNQAMVRAHLLKTSTDRAFRLQVLEEAMSNFHRYLFVMPTLAAFELECYTKLESGKALTADVMSETLLALLREGYGDAVTIDDARMGISWATFTHLFSPYYVYQYATGISAANALCEQVLSEGRPAAERYLSFLKAGGSLYPLDAILLAGVDMLSPAPIEAAFRVVARVVEEIEALVATS